MSLESLRRSADAARQRSDLMVTRALSPGMLASGGQGSMLGAMNQSRLLMGTKNLDPEKYNTGWVYACVRVAGQRIAQQDFVVARKRKRARRQKYDKSMEDITPKNFHNQLDTLDILDSHPLIDTLNAPNQLMTKWALLFVTVGSLELSGCCFYWVRDDDGDGRKDIWPIPTHWMSPIYGTDNVHSAWMIRPENCTETFIIPADQIVYFSYPNPFSPIRPTSPLQAASRPVVVDENILECQRRSFNSPHPSMALTVGRLGGTNGINGPRPELTPEQRARIDGLFSQMYSGSINFNRPIILDGMLEKIDFLSNGVKEMDYPNTTKGIKDRITQLFATNPIVLGHVEGANRASALTADQNYLSININPKLEMLSEVFTRWLCPLFAAPNEELVCWIKPALTVDREMDLAEGTAMMDRGCLRVDEFRRLKGFEPVGGKLGKMFMMPNTMILLDKDGEPQNQPDPAEADPPQDVSATDDADAADATGKDTPKADAADKHLAADFRDQTQARLTVGWTIRLLSQTSRDAVLETLHKAAIAAATAELWTAKGQWQVNKEIVTTAKSWASGRDIHLPLDDAFCREEIARAMEFGRSLIKEDGSGGAA